MHEKRAAHSDMYVWIYETKPKISSSRRKTLLSVLHERHSEREKERKKESESESERKSYNYFKCIKSTTISFIICVCGDVIRGMDVWMNVSGSEKWCTIYSAIFLNFEHFVNPIHEWMMSA